MSPQDFADGFLDDSIDSIFPSQDTSSASSSSSVSSVESDQQNRRDGLRSHDERKQTRRFSHSTYVGRSSDDDDE